MSLINDALKRASTQKPVAPAPGGPLLQPVESSDEKSSLPTVLAIVGVGAILMAGAFWLKSKGTPNGSGEQFAKQSAAKPSSSTAALVESKPALNPIERANATLQKVAERNNEQTEVIAKPASTVPASTQPAPLIAASTPTVTPSPSVTAPAVATPPVSIPAVAAPAPEQVKPEPVKVEPAAPRTPNFHLQAIYYRMHGPTVIINGKTLKVGDEVDGAKLIDIERTSAEIEYRGDRQKLRMH